MSDSTELIELRDRMDRLESEQSIRNLIAEYAHGFDKRDRPRFLAIWHPDAEWTGAPENMIGIDAIDGALDRMWAEGQESHHWAANINVVLDGERATSISDADVSVIGRSGRPTIVAATYNDEFERRDGVWKFTGRRISVWYQGQIANTKVERTTVA